MSSLGGACEITVEDEATYPHQLKTLKKINCKVRVDARFEKIYGHGDGFGRGLLAEPVDLGSTPRPRGPPRQLGANSQQKSALKKPVGVGSHPPSPGMGVSEAVTLKQALRKLCISQASEMAAMKRFSKPPGTSGSSSDAGTTKQGVYASVVVQSNKSADKQKESLFEISIIPQKIDHELVGQASESADAFKVENVSSSKADACAKATKPRLKDVIASPLTDCGTKSPGETAKGKSKSRPRDYATLRIGDRSFKFCLTPRLTPKTKTSLQSKVNAEPAVQENKGVDTVTPHTNKSDSVADCERDLGGQRTTEGGRAKEKGESSQSSKSSTCEHSSSSTSVSDESSQSTSSGRGFSRPHTCKDSRWMVVREAEIRQGGLSLDNFVLLKRLGCGDIGTVYLAELLGTDCLFALKVMDVDFLLSRKKMTRAQTEREILNILDHPFLPTLFTHFTTDNLSCLVMEYCPGGDLHVLRQRQPARCFSESAARFYVAEVLLALEYLHMLGVVYRDLKPENILVREDGHIMLSDFDLSLQCVVNPTLLRSSSLGGLGDSGRRSSSCVDPPCLHPSWVNVSCFAPGGSAKSAVAEGRRKATVAALPQLVVEPTGARSNSFVGTHEYLAPEIIKGDGHGSAVDWWTLGVFLYELLFGRTPFKGAVNEETLANVVTQDLRFPASPCVSLHARSLVCGLLAKDPESRLGSRRGAAEIKQHPFFHGVNWALIRSATPPETPPPPPAITPVPRGKKAGGCLEFKAQDERIEFELF